MEKYKGVNSGQLQYFRVFLATKKHLQEKERIPKVYWAWMGHSKGDFSSKRKHGMKSLKNQRLPTGVCFIPMTNLRSYEIHEFRGIV